MLGRAVIGAVEYACRLLKERVDVTCVEGEVRWLGRKCYLCGRLVGHRQQNSHKCSQIK